MIGRLRDQLAEHAPEYDAIVNIAAMPKDTIDFEPCLSDGFDLFDEYERIKRYHMHSHLLMTHLCTHHLGPDGYILYNSELSCHSPSLVPKNQRNPSVLNFVKNATVAKMGSDLAEDLTDQGMVWVNNVVNVLLSEQLITEK